MNPYAVKIMTDDVLTIKLSLRQFKVISSDMIDFWAIFREM